MANNKDLVSTAKPKVTGAVSVAPLGSALPTDATSELDTAFKSLGFVSEDGFTISTSSTSENIKEWGGEVVNSSQTEKSESAKIKLIEALNAEVLKFVYGSSNVPKIITLSPYLKLFFSFDFFMLHNILNLVFVIVFVSDHLEQTH